MNKKDEFGLRQGYWVEETINYISKTYYKDGLIIGNKEVYSTVRNNILYRAKYFYDTDVYVEGLTSRMETAINLFYCPSGEFQSSSYTTEFSGKTDYEYITQHFEEEY